MQYLAMSFLLLPRMALSYPGYILAIILILKPKNRSFAYAYIASAFLIISYCLSLFVGNISPTSFAIEYILCLPIILILCGYIPRIDLGSAYQLAKLINLGISLLSLLNMINHGFPVLLPYIHYLPDVYGGLYGAGGAKIVTVIGFFGILISLKVHNRILLNKWTLLFGVNFLFPSYILGIFCGLAALSIWFIRTKRDFLIATIIGFLIIGYILSRLDAIDLSVAGEFGAHPKILAFINVSELFSVYPELLLTGVGVGQYSSTAALWASDYFKEISTQGIPNLPGLFSSSYQNIGIGEIFKFYQGDSWALSSSFNKPYSSLSTVLAETGIVGLLIFVYAINKALKISIDQTLVYYSAVIFISLMFFLDSWHDNPWFSFMLCLLLAKDLRCEN